MKILFAVLAVAAAVVAVCLIRAARLKAKPSGNAEHKKEFDDDTAAVDRFCEILRKKTVWPRNGNIDYAEFGAFLPLLKRLYPAAFAVLEENIINNYGILLRWKGKNPARSLLCLWRTMMLLRLMKANGIIRRSERRFTTARFTREALLTQSA